MRRFLSAAFCLLGFGLLAWTGCDSIGLGTTKPENAPDGPSFDVRLTDAPGDIVRAVVTVKRVSVVPANGSGEGNARQGGVELLSDSVFTTDLTTLQAGVDTALASVDSIPAGTYSQIRLVTADTATVFYETHRGDSARADLKQPSASETGIKINFTPITLDEPSDHAEVTLDFSVEDSFVKAGRSGKFIFKPVVRAQSVVVNGDTTGT